MSVEEYNEEEEYERNEDNEFEDDEYQEEEETKKSRKGARIVLIIAVILLVGLNAYLYMKMKERKDALDVKTAEYKELKEAKRKVDSTLAVYEERIDSLAATVDDKKGIIAELQAEVDKFKKLYQSAEAKAQRYSKYVGAQRELDAFKKKFKEKEAELDSLRQANKKLVKQNQDLNQLSQKQLDSINNLVENNNFLEQKYEVAKRHNAMVNDISTYKERFNGDLKTTDKARQVNVMKITYTLRENAVADKGKTAVYISVSFNNKVITPKGKVKLNNKKEVEYTAKEDLMFNGSAIESSLTIKDSDVQFDEGNYTVNVYIDGVLKASATKRLL